MEHNLDSKTGLFVLQSSTFRTFPRVPQVLHADELVIAVESVVLGLGVMIVKVLSEELQDDKDVSTLAEVT